MVVFNVATIAYIEQGSDTYLTLISGERVHVRESADEIVERVLAWQRQILDGPMVVEASA